MNDYPIIHKEVPTFYFVGVTTGKSSINKVFPLWMEVLGRPEVVLEGIDHKKPTIGRLSGDGGADQIRHQFARGAGDP
ncbi:hypothetical protein [Candidatus Amarobacter glycogenicus]|uniref:hypothetical protein n=1 Tax=Candidatus Amarobacter glycogenicus TaxID=3140699 RepID=UPI0031CC77EF